MRNLVQFAARSPQLDTAQVAADAAAAAELLRDAPMRGQLLLLTPADPRRTVIPAWPIASAADLQWLRECAQSSSNWLGAFGAFLISNMTGVDGPAILLDEISGINANLRMPIATVLLSDKRTVELQADWLGHPDQLVKAATARVLARRDLDPLQLDALVGDPDLTVRFAALRSAAEVDGNAFERAAATAVTSEPTGWTCTDCGQLQPMSALDCGSCTRGSRSELSDELESLGKKRAQD